MIYAMRSGRTVLLSDRPFIALGDDEEIVDVGLPLDREGPSVMFSESSESPVVNHPLPAFWGAA